MATKISEFVIVTNRTVQFSLLRHLDCLTFLLVRSLRLENITNLIHSTTQYLQQPTIFVNLVHFGSFPQLDSCYFGSFWFILVHFGSFWFILVHFGSFWFILVHFGSFWFILVHFGSFRYPKIRKVLNIK